MKGINIRKLALKETTYAALFGYGVVWCAVRMVNNDIGPNLIAFWTWPCWAQVILGIIGVHSIFLYFSIKKLARKRIKEIKWELENGIEDPRRMFR